MHVNLAIDCENKKVSIQIFKLLTKIEYVVSKEISNW